MMLQRRRVKDKFNFATVRAVVCIGKPEISLGVSMHSQADVPLDYSIEKVVTRIGDRVPKKSGYNLTKYKCPPRGNAWFDDHFIDIGTPPCPGSLEGLIEFDVKYGPVGTLRHELKIRKQVILAFNETGSLISANWQDAAYA
jgi:hypothetical protein